MSPDSRYSFKLLMPWVMLLSLELPGLEEAAIDFPARPHGRLRLLAEVPVLESLTMLKLPQCHNPPSVLERILRSSPQLENTATKRRESSRNKSTSCGCDKYLQSDIAGFQDAEIPLPLYARAS